MVRRALDGVQVMQKVGEVLLDVIEEIDKIVEIDKIAGIVEIVEKEETTKAVDALNVEKMDTWQENVQKLVTVEANEGAAIAASSVAKKVTSLVIVQKREKEATIVDVLNVVKMVTWLENAQIPQIKKAKDVEEAVEVEALGLASNATKKVIWLEIVQKQEAKMISKTQELHIKDQDVMKEMVSKETQMMMLGVMVVATSKLMAGATATLKATQNGEAIL